MLRDIPSGRMKGISFFYSIKGGLIMNEIAEKDVISIPLIITIILLVVVLLLLIKTIFSKEKRKNRLL